MGLQFKQFTCAALSSRHLRPADLAVLARLEDESRKHTLWLVNLAVLAVDQPTQTWFVEIGNGYAEGWSSYNDHMRKEGFSAEFVHLIHQLAQHGIRLVQFTEEIADPQPQSASANAVR